MEQREQVMAWMAQAGAGPFDPRPNDYGKVVDVFAKVADLAAAAERRKHQADIEAWKAEAVTAEKWRGMALAIDPMQPGKAVQAIQQEAAAAEREACAKVCDAFVDIKEAERSRKRVEESLGGCLDGEINAMRHELTVSTYNAGIKSCAAAIRARGQEVA